MRFPKRSTSVFAVLLLAFAGVVPACGGGGGGGSAGPTPDPTGTITSSLRKQGSGNYAIDFSLGVIGQPCLNSVNASAVDDLRHDVNNNFITSSGAGCGANIVNQIASVGPISGVGDITSVPTNGWTSSAAIVIGHGYVITDAMTPNTYWRLFTESWVLSSTTGGIIGVVVRWNTLEPTSPPPPIDGAVTVANALPFGLAVDASAVYVVGTEAGQWRIEKRAKMDLALVSGFGTGGVVKVNPTVSGDVAKAIAIDSTHMYVVGYDTSADPQWRIEKRSLADGALDFGFGFAGVITSNLAGNEHTVAVAIDGSSMYVAGVDDGPLTPGDFGFGNPRWRVEKRSLATGALDPTFDSDGVAVNGGAPHPNQSDQASMAIGNGALYLAGTYVNWNIIKRSLSDGSLTSSFGTNGIISNNEGGNLMAIGIDASFMYLGGSEGFSWRMEKRSNSDGAVDTTFGNSGEIVVNPGQGNNRVWAIAMDGPSFYATGNDEQSGQPAVWRTEKRTTATGLPVSTFGSGGVVTSIPLSSGSYPRALVLDGSNLYIAGVGATGSEWRIEKTGK